MRTIWSVLAGSPAVRKASGALYAGAAGALAAAMLDGSLTGREVVASLGAGLAASVAAYKLRNP